MAALNEGHELDFEEERQDVNKALGIFQPGLILGGLIQPSVSRNILK